jgi:hypothetical protein
VGFNYSFEIAIGNTLWGIAFLDAFFLSNKKAHKVPRPVETNALGRFTGG